MINHVRTLLMQQPATALRFDSSVIGDELLDEYTPPVRLPESVRRVRRILFGDNPDRWMLNYRLRQLLAVVAASELAEYVQYQDSRITYDFLSQPYTADGVFSPQVFLQSGYAPTTLAFVGVPGTPDNEGRMRRVWDVAIESSVNCSLRNSLEATTTVASYSSGLSNIAPLAGEVDYGFRHTAFTADPGEGPRARIELLVRPQVSPAELLTRVQASLSQEHQIDLFMVLRNSAPTTMFYAVWRSHREFTARLAALVLAMAWRTETLG